MRESVARTLKTCPVCARPVSGHEYFDIAFVTAGAAQEADAMALSRARNWRALGRYREADMQTDICAWRALRCPSGGMTLAILLTRYDYSREDRLREQFP
jgi:hypothetical protein